MVGCKGSVSLDARFDAGYFCTVKVGRLEFKGTAFRAPPPPPPPPPTLDKASDFGVLWFPIPLAADPPLPPASCIFDFLCDVDSCTAVPLVL